MPANILVIDDEDIMREYVEESLVRAGHSVKSASNGKDGLAAMRDGSFDLVVTDLKMAPMDGLEVVKRVRHGVGQVGFSHVGRLVPSAARRCRCR